MYKRLFNEFDTDRGDAEACEIQDYCEGHPQNKSEYHYYALSRCIKDTSVTKIIKYALDGFR